MKSLLIAAALCFAGPAVHAQTQCGDPAAVRDLLLDRYGETRVGAGLDPSGALIEVYASLEVGSWSIVMTQPGGPSCLMAAGQSWMTDPAPLDGDPA